MDDAHLERLIEGAAEAAWREAKARGASDQEADQYARDARAAERYRQEVIGAASNRVH